jgi:hypothetical protein
MRQKLPNADFLDDSGDFQKEFFERKIGNKNFRRQQTIGKRVFKRIDLVKQLIKDKRFSIRKLELFFFKFVIIS